MKQRRVFWDNWKGILIALVVFGHFIYAHATNTDAGIIRRIFTFIYLFHMPAFVFVSGYFSKSEKACGKASIMKLILYYLIFNSLMMLYYSVSRRELPQLLTPYNSYWYLLSLIVWRVSVKHIAGIKGILPMAAVAAVLVGFWGEISNFLSLARTVAFYIFFLLGYRFDWGKFRAIAGKTTGRKIAAAVLAVCAAVVLFILCGRVNMDVNTLCMQPYTEERQMLYRAFIMVSAAVMIAVMLVTVPDVRIPLLTAWGKNSLLIYLVHRFAVIVFNKVVPFSIGSRRYLVYAAIGAVITLAVLSSEWLNTKVKKLFDCGTKHIISGSRVGKTMVSLCLAAILLVGMLPLYSIVKNREPAEEKQIDVPSAISNSAVIAYVGDLVLLKEQVLSAKDEETGQYDFSEMFRYAEPYLSQADFAIGVLEGPLAGEEYGYTTSDFDDGYRLLMNFPDRFAKDIKDAGIDMVTTANNHVLDMGEEGALRTLDVLDDAGLQHTGSYRNQEEKDALMLIEVDGIEIAVLSYTQLVNRHTTGQVVAELPYITSIMPAETEQDYEFLLRQIEEDFAAAKAAEPDLIMVLPHMGTQFSLTTDAFQNKWNKLFADLGADIILGDHVHTVQPIEYIGDTLVVNCPGNFADGYVGDNSDAKAIVEVYIDRTTKKVSGTAVIPMYTQEMERGYYRALPIYDVYASEALYNEMPSRDLERMKQVQELVTENMVGQKVSVDDIRQRYYYIDGQYCDYRQPLIEDPDAYAECLPYQWIEESTHVVFIGDEVTAGTRNGGHPWYEPLMVRFAEKQVTNISELSYNAQYMVRNYAEQIKDAQGDLYVIALGMNDVRYQNYKGYASSAEAYVEQMDALTELIAQTAPEAKILLLGPWMTLANDSASDLNFEERSEALQRYAEALGAYAEEKQYGFVDTAEYLLQFFEENYQRLYMIRGIVPNAGWGVELYTKAVLECSSMAE